MALLNFHFNCSIDFMRYKMIAFIISVFIFLGTLTVIGIKGINYGVDFKGGYVLETRFEKAPPLSDLRSRLEKLNVGQVSIQQIGNSANDLMIKMERDEKAKEEDTQQNLEKIKMTLGKGVEYRKIETVGPKAGSELTKMASLSVLFALLGILIYVAIRFDWQYAVSAVITQLNDCVAILSLFSVFGLDFNESAIIALLTTAGYSMNDTIVIFDRIRENVAKKGKLSMVEIINLSINETLSRTILTVVATMMALFAMYFFGGSVIAEFSLPIIVGIMVGTFSSIFVAAPLLLVFGFKKAVPLAVNSNLHTH